jgi:hypothetical protein
MQVCECLELCLLPLHAYGKFRKIMQLIFFSIEMNALNMVLETFALLGKPAQGWYR